MATTVKILLITEDRGSGPLRNAGEAARGAGDHADGAGTKFKGFGSTLWEVGDAATNAGSLITEHVTQPFVAGISVAGDFEASLNRFGSVTGSSLQAAGLEVGDFRNLFLEMGAQTQFSAAQAGDAAINMAKGGIAPAVIAAGGLAEVLSLAAAGELGLAAAAEITAKQYGVWADQAASAEEQAAFLGETANLLAQAANASTVDVEDLALGLANAGGSAKVAGLGFGETVQTMALLAPGFSSAADAGTSFKTFLANMQPQSKAAAEAMRQLGLFSGLTADEYSSLQDKVAKVDAQILKLDPTTKNYTSKLKELTDKKAALTAQMENGRSAFYDEEGSFIGMEAAAQKLQDATKDLTDEQRIQALQTIFGSDAIRAAAIIAEQGGDGFRGMGEEMRGAGTAAEQAAERNKGFNFALESLKGSVETLQIELGEKLLPTATRLIQEFLIPGVNWLGNLTPEVQTAIVGFAGFLALLGPGLLVLGGVASGIAAITGVFTTFAGMAPAFGAAWTIATGPVGLAVLAIAGLVAAIAGAKYAWDNDLGGMRTKLIAWGQEIKEGFGVVTNFFSTWGTQIQTGAGRIGESFTTWGAQIQTGAGRVGDFFTTWGAQIQTGAGRVGASFANLGQSISGWSSGLGERLENGAKIVIDFFTGFGRRLENGWNDITRRAGNLGAALTNTFTKIPMSLGDVGKNIVDGVWEGLRNAWNGLLTNTRDLVTGPGGFVDTFKGLLGIRSPSTVMEDQGEDTGEGFAIGLINKRERILDAGTALAGAAVAGVRDGSGPTATAVAAGPMPAAPAPAGETHYHLHINTSAPVEPILHDYAMLRALAGAGV